MISYAGVELTIPQDADLVARLQDFVRIEDIDEFQSPEWTGLDENWRTADWATRRPIKLGRLFWPRGASQWATAHLLATEDQLDRIRALVYTGDSRGMLPKDLVISDDNGGIVTTKMYMTPPRPLWQWDIKGGADNRAN